MEQYSGIKFKYKSIKEKYQFNENLLKLNRVAYELSKIGLTPVHPKGAYGNFSMRIDDGFIISKSAFIPTEKFITKNYAKVMLKKQNEKFLTKGLTKPSSETPLHHAIYCNNNKINVIIHGHYNKFENKNLLAITDSFYDYGTPELVDSAIRIISQTDEIIYLKNHGFVAYGKNLKTVTNLIYKLLKLSQI